MKRLRKMITIIFFLIFVICIFLFINNKINKKNFDENINEPNIKDDIEFVAKAKSKNFYIYEDNRWKNKKVLGVNMGVTKPGSDFKERNITKQEYLRWFGQISQMNANSIRVYTWQSPEFYEALLEYNNTNENKLYLQQGIWFEQQENKDIEICKQEFIKETEKIIDIVHGNYKDMENTYSNDISKYVISYILGSEWEAKYINMVNNNNSKNYNRNILIYS